MINYFFSNFFIQFSNDYTILLWLWIYTFIVKSKYSIDLIQLLSATLIINVWLKYLWMIPLPYKSQTFAFPSGHMHSATIVYFYPFLMFAQYSSRYLLVIILLGISYAEISLGYHNIKDLFAGFGFGVLHIIIFHYCNIFYGKKMTSWYILLLCTPITFMYGYQLDFLYACLTLLITHHLVLLLPIRFIKEVKSSLKTNLMMIATSLFALVIFKNYFNSISMVVFYPIIYLLVIILPIFFFNTTLMRNHICN